MNVKQINLEDKLNQELEGHLRELNDIIHEIQSEQGRATGNTFNKNRRGGVVNEDKKSTKTNGSVQFASQTTKDSHNKNYQKINDSSPGGIRESLNTENIKDKMVRLNTINPYQKMAKNMKKEIFAERTSTFSGEALDFIRSTKTLKVPEKVDKVLKNSLPMAKTIDGVNAA